MFPDPDFERVTEVESSGRARSAGFDSSVRLSREDGKASGLVRYQYGQSWNDSDGPTSLPADSRDLDAEWGPASWDVRHRVFGFVRMELPMGLRANAWGDLASGAPYTIRTGLDDNGDTVFTDRPEGLGRNTERATWQRTLNLRLGMAPGASLAADPLPMRWRHRARRRARAASSSTPRRGTSSTRPTSRATPA